MARSTPSLKDVARHAGVSIATVSRVINEGPYVAPELRARIQASMQAVGYVPHALARSLRTGRTNSVGYLIGDIANGMFATIARGIDDVLQQHGYTTLLANSRDDAQQDLRMIGELQGRRVDGLILSLADDTAPAICEVLRGLSIPVVLLDREPPGVGADRVLVNHRQGVFKALRHLQALGHRHVALVTGGPSTRPGRAIAEAFRDAVAELGLLSTPTDQMVGSFRPAFGAEAIGALLDRPRPPSAVLVGGAQLTPGALRELRRRGVRLPHDLSLVAYDDTDVTALYSPAVTVIARDVHHIGAEAARLLLDRLGGNIAARSHIITVPTGLVLRDSTGPV
jgi:LacI family transcriptional regulator